MAQTISLNEYDVDEKFEPRVASEEFLIFRVGKKEYAIRPVRVQGLRGYESVIPISGAPDFMPGIIHSSGTIVPIIDLRFQFEPGNPAYDANTNVLILKVANRIVGMAVANVTKITTISAEQIKPAPELQSAYDTDSLIGIAIIDHRKIHLIDIDRVMTKIGMCLMEKFAA